MNAWLTRLIFAVLLSVAVAHSASASTAEIELISGASTQFITDNAAPSTPFIYGGSFAGWTISVVVAQSSALYPLQLTTNVTGPGGASSLDILFSATQFTADNEPFSTAYSVATIGGGTGNASESAYLSEGDALFQETTPIGTVGPFANPASGYTTGGPSGTSSYSLTLEQVLNETSGAATTFGSSGSISPTPELSTLLLFGTGLLAIGGILRRKGTLGR
jgi:hypothetical protein